MSDYRKQADASAAGLRVAIVASRYHAQIIDRMREGAVETFIAGGGNPDDLEIFDAPGSFELPVIASAAARSGKFDAVVTLGCVMQGETRHDEVIADAIASALANLSVETGVPVGFGVLTVSTIEQAEARAGGAVGNKGAEAMTAALECVAAVRAARSGSGAGVSR